MSELDRRDFLKLVGAGAGAAAAAGCAEPIEKLVPYVIQPEEITPGIAVRYASTCGECPVSCGLHVTTREGRPVKLEGNPDHPINRGALCARGQASIGRTYHPDRYTGPHSRGNDGVLAPISWEDAQGSLAKAVRAASGKVRILGSDRGPSLNGVLDAFAEASGGSRVVYETFAPDALRAATEQVFGERTTPLFDLSGTDLIVDFGSDFLDAGLSPVEHAAQFTTARDVSNHRDGGARLVSIGPRLSMTGSRADQWLATKAGSEGIIALALAKAVYDETHGERVRGDRGAVESALAAGDLGRAASAAGVERTELDALVTKLVAAKHPVALPPGVSATSTAAVSNASSVLLLNAVLGAVNGALKLPAEETAPAPANMAEIQGLVTDMKAGRVSLLLIHDVNPVYSLPSALGFADALSKVGTVVSFASSMDETSERAHLVLPDHTALESWGDAEPRKGVRSVIQPTIRPLYDTRSVADTLLQVAAGAGLSGLPSGTFKEILEGNWADVGFRAALSRGGFFEATPTQDAEVASSASGVSVASPKLAGSGALALVAYAHSFLGDGRGAALPWLQETPDPVTRVAWNTWVELSMATADRLGFDFGDVVTVQTDAGAIEASVLPRGGIRDDVVAVPIGQGHTVGHYASMAGDGDPGVARGANVLDILPAATDEKGGRSFLTSNASVTKTGKFRRLALAQWFDNQRGRELAPAVSVAALSGHGGGEHDAHAAFKLAYDPANDSDPDSDYRWGMTIDNDKCTGCGACVVACDIENNIPQVGEQQSIMHREMSWIRIDRYVGDGDRSQGAARRPYPNSERLGETDVRLHPLLCQQCGAAPCESVCPVIATYHTPDGLNGMVYNRCVGTRYCANNCSYKVRRFNYWDYSGNNWPGLLRMMLNPDVTVRGRGVMEKCSFCVQRIAGARQTAKDEDRLIADGEIKTACQQSCPTQAITFGNTKDTASAVVEQTHDEARHYTALQDLNTRPAVTYLAQVQRETESGAEAEQHDSHKGSH